MQRVFTLIAFFLLTVLQAQISVCSWNIENLGKSKSEENILFIVNTIKKFDIVAIQEVVAGSGGAQAVAQIAEELNRKGTQWDYTISDPTSGSSYKRERYAFLWRTNKVKLKKEAWLEQKYNQEIDREPYFATFEHNGKVFTLVTFHAITQSKQPETEIKYFKFLPNEYPTLNLVFAGDFNCPQSHSVFNPLKKMGYDSVFKNQKTSLKREYNNGNCLASEFDNFWYHSERVSISNPKAIQFYEGFENLNEAREISDHIPITVEITLK
ncbi:endonuclease/exonuclease/phosphatase family protein [Flavobacterium sp.]|uniref:endonuclease/exonuclease/phosphatase family protein n=1 Tax=Flavobacterium sp. TaxID=239 RepID=UPI003D6AF931